MTRYGSACQNFFIICRKDNYGEAWFYYNTEEAYEEYQARKQAEEEIQMMQMAYDEEQSRPQRLDEEWQAQQQILFQELHGDHYDN